MRLAAIMLFFGTALSANTLFRVACGGQGGSDVLGNNWTPDQYFSGGTTWSNSSSLDNPYKNLRFNPSFSYVFPVAVGNYKITFKFLEPNKTGSGQRVFNILVNGTPVLTNIDIINLIHLPNVPYDIQVQVGTSLPTLKIDFKGVVGNAVISGIQIDSVGTTATSSCLICYNGSIDKTDLTSDIFEQEIPIFNHMTGGFLYFKITLEVATRFLGHTTLEASIGRPGTNHNELLGTYVDLTSPDGFFWQDSPISPQLHDFYDIVLALKSTGSPIKNATTGQLNWQICGFLPSAPNVQTNLPRRIK